MEDTRIANNDIQLALLADNILNSSINRFFGCDIKGNGLDVGVVIEVHCLDTSRGRIDFAARIAELISTVIQMSVSKILHPEE